MKVWGTVAPSLERSDKMDTTIVARKTVRELRMERHLSQAQLAAAAGITHSLMERIDNGRVYRGGNRYQYTDFDSAARVAKVLGEAVEDIKWLLPLKDSGSKPGLKRGTTAYSPVVQNARICGSCYVQLPADPAVGCDTCD